MNRWHTLFLFLHCVTILGYCEQEKQIQQKASIDMENSTESENQLLQTVLQGRFDAFKAGAVYSPFVHAEFQEMDLKVLYAWGMDYVCGNGIIEKNQNRIPTEEEIDWTIDHFSTKKLPFMWWTSANVLESKGFQYGGILTGIVLDLSQEMPVNSSAFSDLKIEIVQSEADMRAFAQLTASAYMMSAGTTEQWLQLNMEIRKHEEQVHFLAYLDGMPVGTATLAISPSSAGIWNLATLPEYRKQGIGAALVHAVCVEAKKRQQTQVMAVLMPKGMAWGLFMKLGFQAVCEFPFYIYGIPAEELEKS